MTIETCASVCADYNYFGLEYGQECWCGNTIRSVGQPTAASECNFPCAGNAAQICGAGDRINIYSFGTVTTTSSIAASTTTVQPTTLVTSSTTSQMFSTTSESTTSEIPSSTTSTHDPTTSTSVLSSSTTSEVVSSSVTTTIESSSTTSTTPLVCFALKSRQGHLLIHCSLLALLPPHLWSH
jgi:iron transport multicopper oxidase